MSDDDDSDEWGAAELVIPPPGKTRDPSAKATNAASIVPHNSTPKGVSIQTQTTAAETIDDDDHDDDHDDPLIIVDLTQFTHDKIPL